MPTRTVPTGIQSLAYDFPNFDDIDAFADLDASPLMKMLHIDHDVSTCQSNLNRRISADLDYFGLWGIQYTPSAKPF